MKHISLQYISAKYMSLIIRYTSPFHEVSRTVYSGKMPVVIEANQTLLNSTGRVLSWLVLLISTQRGHPLGHHSQINKSQLHGHSAASVFSGVWSGGSTSRLLRRVLGSFSIRRLHSPGPDDQPPLGTFQIIFRTIFHHVSFFDV